MSKADALRQCLLEQGIGKSITGDKLGGIQGRPDAVTLRHVYVYRAKSLMGPFKEMGVLTQPYNYAPRIVATPILVATKRISSDEAGTHLGDEMFGVVVVVVEVELEFIDGEVALFGLDIGPEEALAV